MNIHLYFGIQTSEPSENIPIQYLHTIIYLRESKKKSLESLASSIQKINE